MSIGATGRSIILKIGVYTLSQPGGVLKLVAPRIDIAPGGVPRSSGAMKARKILSAVSRDIAAFLLTNATSSLIMPMLPIESVIVTVKNGYHFPPDVLTK